MPPKKTTTTVPGPSSTGTRGTRKRAGEDALANNAAAMTNANTDDSRKSTRAKTRTVKAADGESEAGTKKSTAKRTTSKKTKKANITTAVTTEPEAAPTPARKGPAKTKITGTHKPQKIQKNQKPRRPSTRSAHLIPEENYARVLYIKRLIQLNRDALRGEELASLGLVIDTLADAFNQLDRLAPEPNIGSDYVEAPPLGEEQDDGGLPVEENADQGDEEEEDEDDFGGVSSVAASKPKRKGKGRKAN